MSVSSWKIPVRSEQETVLIKKSGQITAQALKKAIQAAVPGKTLFDIEKVASEEIEKLGGKSAFKTVPNYFWTTCLTVNDEVVHGIPRKIVLQEGDILGIDLGAVYKGWYTDAAWSIEVGRGLDEQKKIFLKVGEEALWNSIAEVMPGHHIGDISSSIQQTIEAAGFNVVKCLSGHGVGKSYHEEPEVPTFGRKGQGAKLEKGMVLAIEAIYASGEGQVYEKEDGWTVATDDGGYGGLFEMTVIVRDGQPEVVTDWRRV